MPGWPRNAERLAWVHGGLCSVLSKRTTEAWVWASATSPGEVSAEQMQGELPAHVGIEDTTTLIETMVSRNLNLSYKPGSLAAPQAAVELGHAP